MLAAALLQHVRPHDPRRVEWPRVDLAHQRVLSAMGWRSRSPRDEAAVRELIGRISRHLAIDDRSFVLFHVDGDIAWSRAATSSTHRQWRETIVERVTRYLTAGKRAADAGSALRRLILVGPHYSVEAWLYQNATESTRLCRLHHGGKHVPRLEAHVNDRAGLDEIDQPKEHFCLRDEHNLALACTGYPMAAVIAAGASLAATLERLRACSDLDAALASAAFGT